MAAAADVANDALKRSEILRTELDLFRKHFDTLNLPDLRERVKVVEEVVTQLTRKADEADKLRQQIAVLEDRVAELMKAKEQASNRLWNVLMIAVGAILSLLRGVVVQLIALNIKK